VTFLFPLLLGGLILAGIPVALHLIMRQKPKMLIFPAFRFLVQSQRTNQRKLRLRHLLLLAARLALLIAICLAFARPKVFSGRFSLGGDRPVAAVLLFDTSYSMGYKSGGLTRLEEAKKRALELLTELSTDSRIAVLDSAEAGGEWLTSTFLARDRITELRLQSANNAVTTRLMEAYRLLSDLDQDPQTAGETLPRFLYIFSDRTQECWDFRRQADLVRFRDRLGTPVQAIFVDIGTNKPVDVAVTGIEVPSQTAGPDNKISIRATVRATGEGCNTELACRIDDEKTVDRKPIVLGAGESQILTFERSELPLGLHQLELSLASDDALACNNSYFATMKIAGPRRLLALVDEIPDADFWKTALATKGFQCDVQRATDALSLTAAELQKYKAVCLMNVAAPSPDLWETLVRYVDEGHGLVIMPGNDRLSKNAYNQSPFALRLMPGALDRVIKADIMPGAIWQVSTYQHPVLLPFREWGQSGDYDFIRFPPAALRYWAVNPYKVGQTIVHYADRDNRPALLERQFDGKQHGRVLLFTTPFDRRHLEIDPAWNDYLHTSFYLVILYSTMDYVAGAADQENLNYYCGQMPALRLAPGPWSPSYTLKGPGLSAADAVVNRTENQEDISFPKAVQPGNYSLYSPDGKPVAQFSINLPPAETVLARVPTEKIEELLGKNSVLPVAHGTSLGEAIQSHWNQPVELFSWLMILLLLLLAAENLFANKFYKREAAAETAAAPMPIATPQEEALPQAG
jgi:hypothetical protein